MKSRPPFEFAYIYLLTALIGFTAADLGILFFRDSMIPSQAPPRNSRGSRFAQQAFQDRNAYNHVVSRNIFNADGVIPDAIGADQKSENPDGPPVPSQLPLALGGTIVHGNTAKSVATVNLRSKNENIAFRLDDEIEGMAKVTKIERDKVTFRNLQTQRLEFIEIKKDQKISFGVSAPKVEGEVVVENEFDRSIKRDDVNRLTSNLPELLQQARAVPNLGPGGRVEGFKVLDIQPGSIYEKLGIKRGDVIKSVNGEPVDSPAKAMELYNALKTSSSIALGIERGGRAETMNYSIK